jgi:hypothetical protein
VIACKDAVARLWAYLDRTIGKVQEDDWRSTWACAGTVAANWSLPDSFGRG